MNRLRQGNNDGPVEVVLKPMPVSMFQNDFNEPQVIQMMNPSEAEITINSSDAKLELNKVQMEVSSIAAVGDRANTLFQNIKRVKFELFGMTFYSPNVNPRNNQIILVSSNTLIEYPLIIPEGFYDFTDDLMDAIVLLLNTVSGLSGLTFSHIPKALFPGWYILSCVGGSYYFKNTSTAITKGVQCYALPQDQSFTSSKTVGHMGLYYTRYVDLVSNRLASYTTIPSRSTGTKSNIIARIDVPSASGDEYLYPTFHHDAPFNNVSLNWNSGEPLSSFDMSLYDQNGDLLYVPTGGGPGSQSGFEWTLVLTVQF